MTQTLTTKVLNDFITGQGYGVAPSAVEAMARELLANREAQPVVEPYMYELWKWDETVPELDRWFLVERSHEKLVAGKEQKVVILYTAPPAPAVPPEKKLPELMMASYHEAIGWNACRAAMLAAAPEGGNDA